MAFGEQHHGFAAGQLVSLCIAGPLMSLAAALHSAMYFGLSYVGMTLATSCAKALFDMAFTGNRTA
jgi:hypothetical protein